MLKAFADVLNKMLQRPWVPLFVFSAAIIVEFSFDSYFIRHEPWDISVETFKWFDPLHNPKSAARELTARLTIEVVELIRAVLIIWVLYVSLKTVAQFWSGLDLGQKIALPILALLGIATYTLLWSDHFAIIPNPYTDNVLSATLTDKAQTLAKRDDFGGPILKYGDDATHLALVAVALAAGITIGKKVVTVLELQERLKALTLLLYSCAALLVFHVIGAGASLLWPAAMLSQLNGESDIVMKLAIATVLNCSVFYTGLLIAFHIPAVHAITTQANQLPHVPPLTAEEKRKWLTENELTDTWRQYYIRIATVLSPLLAGISLTKVLTYIHG